MSSLESNGLSLGRREAMAFLGGGALTSLAPTTDAKRDLPPRVRAQRGISWATGSTTTAYGTGLGEAPSELVSHEPITGDHVELEPIYDVTHHSAAQNGIGYGQINLMSCITLLNVMWIPWVNRWRYSFHIVGFGGGSSGGGAYANIGGHAATVWQPNIDGRDPSDATLVTSEAMKDTPHAVAYPLGDKEPFDDDWAVSLGNFRLDNDDFAFAWKLGKAVGYEIANTFGGIVSKIETAFALKEDALDAYYDEEYREKHDIDYPERDFTPWYYDTAKDTIAHRRLVEVDVKPASETNYPDVVVDMRSEAVNENICQRHQNETGIRGRQMEGNKPLTPKHVGRSIASNSVRLKLPTLPNPNTMTRSEFDAQSGATLAPYCYVDEDGSVYEDDCLYTVTDIEPDWQWY